MDISSQMASSGPTLPRLLVLSSTYPRWPGDAEPGFVHSLCRRLTRSFEVHVICPHAAGAYPEETLDGVTIHRFRYAPDAIETLVQGGGILNNLKHQPWKWLLVLPFFIGLTWKVWRIGRQLQPDRIHAHWIIPQGLAYTTLRLLQCHPAPLLLTSHGGDLYALRSPLLALFKRLVIRQASTITVVSQAMVTEAIRLGARPEQVRVVPMGVDFDVFAATPTDIRNSAEILFVGRLVEKKGLRLLLEAMPSVLAHIPQAKLTIAGCGPEESALRAQANMLGISEKISFLGALPQTELPALYRRASVFVAPFIEASSGDREGLGLVTVEAIACACPIIVGDVPALDDILEPAEANLRVNPYLTGELADRIVDTLNRPEEAHAVALRIRARLMARLDWENIAIQYKDLLTTSPTQ